MKKIILLCILISAAVGGFTETLSLQDTVRLVLKNDETLQIAAESVESAYQGYRITRSQGYPQLTLQTDPLYGVGMRRDYNFNDFPPVARTTVSNSFSIGLGLSQLLPTGGVLNTSIDDTFQYNIQLAEEDLDQSTALTQQPEFTINYQQPLFVNGKLIDGKLLKAGNDAAELGWRSSQESQLSTKNSVLLRAAQLYLQLISIDKNTAFLQERLVIAKEQLEQSVIDREQGRASENQVLGLEVAVNRQREALLDTDLARIQTENQLRKMIQLGDFSNYTLDPEIEHIITSADDFISKIAGGNIYQKALADNPDITAKRFEGQTKRLQARVNDSEKAANMSMFFTISPRYPDDREDADSFAASFSDFFTDDSGVNLNFGLAFEIPLTDGGARKAQRAADKSGIRLAELNIAAAENDVAEKIQIAQKRNEILRKRMELLQVDIEYQQNRLEREEQLANLKTTTQLKVDSIRLDLLSTENQLWQTGADLLLNLLEMASLAGEPLEKVLVTAKSAE